MKNADQPAYPLAYESRFGDSDQFVTQAQEFGLTKREYFAGVALQGMLMRVDATWMDFGPEYITEQSVVVADALLKALDTPPSGA